MKWIVVDRALINLEPVDEIVLDGSKIKIKIADLGYRTVALSSEEDARKEFASLASWLEAYWVQD